MVEFLTKQNYFKDTDGLDPKICIYQYYRFMSDKLLK